ncbi:hypothetical protein DPM19_32670 [Actinomadura craniellae]|uniref:Twitching motility protein PilT n=1 Tax=Actinomadura craniellae TaxID=2231787 RepID=A0A365GWB7_9ACTN|nr:Mut7-C RNAse domain-containing protein [Actinomadura craniellae]RAY11058.1 hypothetical protein DPM19_32670 [Actinomadura craniellae]
MEIRLAPELTLFLPARDRNGPVRVDADGTSSLGHVVEALGVPLPEVGRLVVDGTEVTAGHRPAAAEIVHVHAVTRPQPAPPRFLLDVHLGTLARRMRLVGLDTAYHNDMDDPELVVQANTERRVLLTQDRGLLRRRALWFGAYVRGSRPDDQFADVLDRFAPPLAPRTRCTACNGLLDPVAKADVAHLVPEGTRRTQDEFARCRDCDQVYWPGAHSEHLESIIAAARRTGS